MTELASVQNLTAGPVLIDPEGHVLGAGETGEAAVRTEHVRALIRAGAVGVVDVDEDKAGKGRKATTTTAQEG